MTAWAIVAPLFLLVAAGLGFLLVGRGPAWLPLLTIAPAALVALALVRWPMSAPREMAADRAGAWLVVGLGLSWAVLLFGRGDVLPIGDPIAVPQFARSIAAGIPLTAAFPPGSSGHAYPPGYPILFAPAEAWLAPDVALVLFKWTSIAVVGVIPATWGWMYRELFAPRQPAWLVLTASYVAFIVIERQLGFLTPFAGKNAVELALLLFPAAAVSTVRLSETPRLWLLTAAPLYGLFLIHYSMAHLAMAFLGACMTVGRPWRWAPILKVAAAGALAAGLMLLTLGEALSDPRAAMGGWTPLAALGLLAHGIVAAKPALVVFHDAHFGLVPALFRIPTLIAAGAVAAAVGVRLHEPSLWRAAATYGLALAASLVFGYGVLPARINLDFVRCFAWPLQAGLFTTAGLALLAIWRRLEGRRRQALAAASVVGGVAAAAISVNDMRVEQRHFATQSLSRSDVQEIAEALPSAGSCVLITPGQANPQLLITVQDARPWNYAEVVGPCRFLTGSWVQPGAAGGRQLEGLPSAAALRELAPGTSVYFAGPTPRLARYAAVLKTQGLTVRPLLVDEEAGDLPVWRLALPAQASNAK